MRFHLGALIFISRQQLSLQAKIQIFFSASSAEYNLVPNVLKLVTVAVFTRHGDRAQITRALSPSHPENSSITSFWMSKMPIERSFRIMAQSAAPLILGNTTGQVITNLYSGIDHSHTPYAQLTENGARQLQAVGHALRDRYVGTLLPHAVEEASDVMFCRSSNICRTIQSLRSLLAGMYTQTSHSDVELQNADTSQLQHTKVPYIFTRHRSVETLYPHADGPCTHMSERRVKLYYHHLNSTAILRWGTLEKRMIDFIGTTHKRIGWLTWLNILDVYTCFQAHDIPFPPGFTESDLENITELVAWTWDTLYEDSLLSRFAIGRFIREAVENMDTALNFTHRPRTDKGKPILDTAIGKDDFTLTAEGTNTKLIPEGDSPSHVGIDGMRDTNKEEKPSGTTPMDATILNKNEEVRSSSRVLNSSPDGHVNNQMHSHAGTKMLIYSGHDSTMVPLLKAIGLYQGDWPPYSSYLTLEVGRLISPDETVFPNGVVGDLFVRAIYNDKDKVMTGCGGALWCHYDTFRTHILKSSMTNAEYHRECRNA